MAKRRQKGFKSDELLGRALRSRRAETRDQAFQYIFTNIHQHACRFLAIEFPDREDQIDDAFAEVGHGILDGTITVPEFSGEGDSFSSWYTRRAKFNLLANLRDMDWGLDLVEISASTEPTTAEEGESDEDDDSILASAGMAAEKARVVNKMRSALARDDRLIFDAYVEHLGSGEFSWAAMLSRKLSGRLSPGLIRTRMSRIKKALGKHWDVDRILDQVARERAERVARPPERVHRAQIAEIYKDLCGNLGWWSRIFNPPPSPDFEGEG